MQIIRRLFVVPLADNNHGKTTMIRALVAQGLGRSFQRHKKGVRSLATPTGRIVDTLVFGRSYQEVEKRDHKSIENTLDANDNGWRARELIILPSHVSDIEAEGDEDDIDQIIDVAHSAGFDVVCATVLLTGGAEDADLSSLVGIWRKPWDERWTVPNQQSADPEGQLEAIGRDLWTWISRALTL